MPVHSVVVVVAVGVKTVAVGVPLTQMAFGFVRNKAVDAAQATGYDGIAKMLATDERRVELQRDAKLEAMVDAVSTLLKKGARMHYLALDYKRSSNPDFDRTRQHAEAYFGKALTKTIEAFHEFHGHAAKQVECIKLELVAQIYLHHPSVERFQLEARECVARLCQENEVQRLIKDGRLTPDTFAYQGSNSALPRHSVRKRLNETEFPKALSQATEFVNDLLGDRSINK